MSEISAEAAKIAQGAQASVGQLSDDARKQWHSIHDESLSMKELFKVLESTRQLGKIRLQEHDKAMTEQRDRIKNPTGRKEDVKVGGYYQGKLVTRTGTNDENGKKVLLFADGTQKEL
jgi:hypothetical protein